MMPKPNGDNLIPKIHPRLALLIEQTDRFRTELSIQRQIPQRDADARMQLVSLERMGLWFPEIVPERGRRAAETSLLASAMYLRRNKAGINEFVLALPGILIGARAVSEERCARACRDGIDDLTEQKLRR